ncbi:hypothetical protein [Legionella sp. km772]|uniref:hypothetical protein n=1 Tax=Legionella sp. km772 TaxID=2498111 RepID=UPI000F8E1E4A|nr:hypothetical protein [Legionella sp. km772]RUR08591.1 hypothetical protein ELY15_10485 [Legionella sp. km772]
MISEREVTKALEAEKKKLIIGLYLQEKFKEAYNPAWLDNMENYAHLESAIDFFYKLNNDNLNIIAIGSENEDTRLNHIRQFKKLEELLDKLVVLTGDSPPIATAFKAKDAALAGIELNQALEGRSLRDLHAQSSNLGIAEKLLNEELGQTEWLGEVDLERMLIKLGIKDRTHIARLNAEDIGMILHFERVKHADAVEPYTIPLLINCGSSGSLRSQGSHWTYAMVTVNPITSSVTIDYQDSMPLSGTEQATLLDAINYQDGAYSAFPTYVNKVANVASSGLQRDGWSCGYRALHGLLNTPSFPVDGGVNLSPEWMQFVGTETESIALRNVVYQQLLSSLEIDPDYFVAMALDEQMVKSSTGGTSYELNGEFTEHYLKLLSEPQQKEVLTTDNFAEEYRNILDQLNKTRVSTARDDSLARLGKKVSEINTNTSLTSDAKLMAILNVLATEHAEILKTMGGKGSELGKVLSSFCLKNFGVVLGKDPLYTIQPGGLTARVLNQLLTVQVKKSEEEALLPPVKKKASETPQVSISAPVIGNAKPTPKISPSADSIKKSRGDLSQPTLRIDKRLTRLGTMFGTHQFCYANKPGGVEPGFRAIDLNAVFFKELDIILDKNLSATSKISQEEKIAFTRLREQLSSADLGGKRVLFAKFVHSQIGGPHAGDRLNNQMQWLCDEIKASVAKNNALSAWMYKLDYADGQKDRLKANKEAIREFVGTRLAGIFSMDNQKQEIAWVKNGEKGMHALLACGWKNGLQELTQFLHGGGEPDYNGVLVEDKSEKVKRSKIIPGLGRNLIFGIAIGDRDGMGKDAQNKGYADGKFYGFDYGKPYEGDGVCASLNDDFSFVDSFAKAPALFRSSSKIGFARHYMYRNYSTFYDTPLSERMEGFHLLRKMITGENPSEEVIKSFPGLRQELHRIQENTPTPPDMVNQLRDMNAACNPRSPIKALIDNQILQLCSGKLSNFDLYFTKMKIDLMDVAIKNNMPYKELSDYLKFIDDMALQAQKSNQLILAKFEQRQLLTKPEIDLLDKLEKIFSPTAVMSHDGTVFLNTMRFDPMEARIPFQLKREENGTYTLSTTNEGIARQLKDELNLTAVRNSAGLSCNLTQENLLKLMAAAELKYHQKRDDLLAKPNCQFIALPGLVEVLNKNNSSEADKINLGFLWREDDSLSLKIIAKTEAQVLVIEELLGKKIARNKEAIIEIPTAKISELNRAIHAAHDLSKVKLVEPEVLPPTVTYHLADIALSKWERVHQRDALESPTTVPLVEPLVRRMATLISDDRVLAQVSDAIFEIADPAVIEKLMSANDKTLADPENIKAIIEERIKDIKEISEELTITTQTPVDSNTAQPMM